jgi:hypothetical protein
MSEPAKLTSEEWTELIRGEEEKRERCWDPQKRWKVLLETLAWAESQKTFQRNTPAACLANQRRLLAEFAAYEARREKRG